MNLAARLQRACLLEGRFQLRSGTVSDRYFDKYRFEADPELLQAVTAGLAPLVGDGVDAIAGPELGGVPLATALALATGRPARFVRRQAKAYGTEQLAEGGPVAGLRLLIVEDVVSTGGQIIESADALRAAGATVERALCVILRDIEAVANLADAGIALTALFSADDLARAVS